MTGFLQYLFRQYDASALAVFRVGFGALLLFESINYGVFLCLECDYFETAFLFKYAGFEWVKPLPVAGLKLVWLGMAGCALAIMAGYYYRIAMVLFSVGFTYQFLLDEALYLNHFYMVILFCILMCFIPANRYWAVDAVLHPQSRSVTAPAWSYFLLGAQLEIILIHAGLVKVTYDWLNLEPLRLWLTARSIDENALLQFLTLDWGIAVASYGAIALHLIGAPLLLFKRTRLAVLLCYACFHITNAFVFNIGIFPWFTLFASLLLFDKDWPKQLWIWLLRKSRWLRHRYPLEPVRFAPDFFSANIRGYHYGIAILLIAWLAVQALLPLRHWARDGNVAWNEDGHRYSWRMKLRSKRATANFHVRSANGQHWEVSPDSYLNRKQVRKMGCIPDMIWQFAGFLETRYTGRGIEDVSVTADVMCSLNGRPAARLVNPQVDLTAISRYEPVTNWILPLQVPLPSPLFEKPRFQLIQ